MWQNLVLVCTLLAVVDAVNPSIELRLEERNEQPAKHQSESTPCQIFTETL